MARVWPPSYTCYTIGVPGPLVPELEDWAASRGLSTEDHLAIILTTVLASYTALRHELQVDHAEFGAHPLQIQVTLDAETPP